MNRKASDPSWLRSDLEKRPCWKNPELIFFFFLRHSPRLPTTLAVSNRSYKTTSDDVTWGGGSTRLRLCASREGNQMRKSQPWRVGIVAAGHPVLGLALGKPTKRLVSGEVSVDQWDSTPQELGKEERGELEINLGAASDRRRWLGISQRHWGGGQKGCPSLGFFWILVKIIQSLSRQEEKKLHCCVGWLSERWPFC